MGRLLADNLDMTTDSDEEWDPDSSCDEDLFNFVEPDACETLKVSQRPPLLDVEDIRILILIESSNYDEEVHCSFQRTSLKNPTAYFALSYAWGETYDDGSHLRNTVFCDHVPYRVTDSLFQALLRLREMCFRRAPHASFPIPALWIDAICINQDNAMERSRQVMVMDRIYRSAQGLLVWIGEPDPLVDGFEVSRFGNTSGFGATELGRGEARYLQHRAYFNRRWVVQEAIQSPLDRHIIFGPYWINVPQLPDVLAGSTTISGLHDRIDHGVPASTQTHVETSTRSQVSDDDTPDHVPNGGDLRSISEPTLMSNLVRFEGKECSLALDRVYALQSISRDGAAVHIDYNKSAEEIFCDLAYRWLENGYVNAVLASAVLTAVGGLPRQTSSWVPDWRYKTNRKDPSVHVVTHTVRHRETLCRGALKDICKDADLVSRSILYTETADVFQVFDTQDRSSLRLRGWLIEPCHDIHITSEFPDLIDDPEDPMAPTGPDQMIYALDDSRMASEQPPSSCTFCNLVSRHHHHQSIVVGTHFFIREDGPFVFQVLPAVRTDPRDEEMAYYLNSELHTVSGLSWRKRDWTEKELTTICLY